MMNNAFYFMLKFLFVLEIFFIILTFSLVKKRSDQKAKVNFRIYELTDWATNNYNTYIAQYLKK